MDLAQSPSRRTGFSLLELTVAIGVLMLLGGLIAPTILRSRADAQAAAILTLVDSLKNASERYYLDTGLFPAENCADIANGAMTPSLPNGYSDIVHELFIEPSITNKWKGPYVSAPLSTFQGMQVAITNHLGHAGPLPGQFVISGSSIDTSKGCALTLTGVSSEVARLVDERFDSMNASANDWMNTGTVIFGRAGTQTGSGTTTGGGATSQGTSGSGSGSSSGGSKGSSSGSGKPSSSPNSSAPQPDTIGILLTVRK